MMLKPSVARSLAASTMRGLSLSLTETNTVPSAGQPRAAADLALGEGGGKRVVEPHDLAGRAHLRPQHRVDAGEAGEREHRLLDGDMVEPRGFQLETGEALAGHHAGG